MSRSPPPTLKAAKVESSQIAHFRCAPDSRVVLYRRRTNECSGDGALSPGSDGPTARKRNDLTIEEVTFRAGEKQDRLSAFPPGRQASRWILGHPLTELFRLSIIQWPIGDVVDVGLRGRVDVDVSGDLHGHVFHIAVLRPARRAIDGDAPPAAAQACGAAHHDNFAALAF